MNAIAITVLQHSFGNHQALCGASFTVAAGSIHGFVGPNGAGKTTCLRILATLLVPQQGQVLVFDKDVARDAQAVRRTIGFMPDHLTMYRQMTVGEYLDFFAAAYGLPPVKRRQVVHDVLALTDMGGRIDHPVKGLSRGMSQRVTLARVLVHDPQLLLLDEPASGLDPRARIELMEILKELQRLGKTVFISSHILSELADLCDEVTILDRGAVKYRRDGRPDQHPQRRRQRLDIAPGHTRRAPALARPGARGGADHRRRRCLAHRPQRR